MELAIFFILVLFVYLLFPEGNNKAQNSSEISDDMLKSLINEIRNNNINEVEKLINSGIDLNDRRMLTSPLACAINTLNIDMVKMLIKYGVDVNQKTERIWYREEQSTEFTKLIESSIYYAIQNCLRESSISDESQNIFMENSTLLCLKKRLEIADILIDAGANLDDIQIQDLYSRAIHENAKIIYEFLLNRNVKANDDALYAAIRIGNYELIKTFLEQGLDPNSKTGTNHFGGIHYEYPAAAIVSTYHRNNTKVIDIIELLLDFGGNINRMGNLMAVVIDNNDIETLDFLIKKGIDLNIYGECFLSEGTPLCIAIGQNKKDILEFLIKKGADINYIDKELDNRTALSYAIEQNKKEFVSILLRAGADPSKPHQECIDAYQFARKHGTIDIIKILEKHKISLQEKSNKIDGKNNIFRPKTNFSREELSLKIKKRGINNLVHFTHLGNLDSILEYGIMPKTLHHHLTTDVKYNDDLRLDNRTEMISLSITFPNAKMFYKYRILNEAEKDSWCVLLLKPEILTEKECLFCPANAASSAVRFASSKHLRSVNAFEAMFGNSEIRSDLNLPPNWPTDVQAEVMVKGVIEPRYIKRIVFDKDFLVDRYRHTHPNFVFSRDHRYFSSREYALASIRAISV